MSDQNKVTGDKNRISRAFAEARQENRAAFVQFICAGDPNKEISQKILNELPNAGVDIIELGMPYSDPMADGPVIQRASQRALGNGHTMQDTFDMVKEFRKHNIKTPIILMGYCNPIFVRGYDNFVEEAQASGVDGLLLVDLPFEENNDLRIAAQRVGIAIIQLVSPVTNSERMKKIVNNASGFIYYVSITGVTGTTTPDMVEVSKQVKNLRSQANLPVAIGFGVNKPAQVASLSKLADGVVVGSAAIATMENLLNQGKDSSEIIDKTLEIVRVLSGSTGTS